MRSRGLTQSAPFEFYRSLDQQVFRPQTVVVRSGSSDTSKLAPAIREIVRSMDPNLPVTGIQTLTDVVAGSVGQQRLVSTLALVFAILAATLATVGVFGVMTYNVRRQTRELGIRLALGADEAAVRRLVVRRGARLAAGGIVLGALCAYVLAGAMEAMLNDVTPRDGQVLAGAALVVLGAAFLASWLPARAAGRTDPLIVLRSS